MKVKEDEAYRAFLHTAGEAGWRGTRIKDVRHRSLRPGGRALLTLFSTPAGAHGRSHPRLRASMPPARDPDPPQELFDTGGPAGPPGSARELRARIQDALARQQPILTASALDLTAAPRASRRYIRNSIRVQRIAAFFAQVHEAVRGWIESGAIPPSQEHAALYVVRTLEDGAYATDLRFDDTTTGTYHSFLHDQPFVHYMERLLDSLPREDSAGFALLPAEARYSVRRQRRQLQNHLDYLMRHKYAYHVVEETDIERTVGGLLIDRDSRRIASEVPGSERLAPRYELVRIAPGAAHAHAGAWVYRDAQGGIHLQDGAPVDVDPGLLRTAPLSAKRLTFRREPESERLRPGMRLDWDGNGYIQTGQIDWVKWAGHCDLHAILEGLGITLADDPRLVEYRSDSGTTTTYDRDLILEMLASALELGSTYRRADNSGMLRQGKLSVGGARNDSLPDRLQLAGQARTFPWPLRGRADAFRVTAIHLPDEQGKLQRADMDTIFFRHLPDLEALDFAPNPRYLGTADGDYNLIDVSGTLLQAEILVQGFDPASGDPTQAKRTTVIDLRPRPQGERFFLGTYIEDPVHRRLYQVYLDRRSERIVADLVAYEQRDGQWLPRTVAAEHLSLPLETPLRCTLGHEMRRDDPAMYQALLDIGFRQARYIVADTDKDQPVWNGAVTRMNMRKIAENPATRVEHWRVDITARFGPASLDYLLRRSETGEPIAYCPAVGEATRGQWPDFLWQELPDIGSKAQKNSDWLVNENMLRRHLIEVAGEPSMPGGIYVYDDHIKNLYEMIFAALAGYRHTIVHANKRHGFTDKTAWQEAVATLETRRKQLTFTGA